MPQMLRLSQGHWLNLEQVIEVRERAFEELLVWTTDCDREPTRLVGEERERLLGWLATHSAYVSVPRADDDTEAPF